MYIKERIKDKCQNKRNLLRSWFPMPSLMNKRDETKKKQQMIMVEQQSEAAGRIELIGNKDIHK